MSRYDWTDWKHDLHDYDTMFNARSEASYAAEFDRAIRALTSQYGGNVEVGRPGYEYYASSRTSSREVPQYQWTIQGFELGKLAADFERYTAILQTQSHEARLRNDNPAIKKAWEQYQLLIAMAGKE